MNRNVSTLTHRRGESVYGLGVGDPVLAKDRGTDFVETSEGLVRN